MPPAVAGAITALASRSRADNLTADRSVTADGSSRGGAGRSDPFAGAAAFLASLSPRAAAIAVMSTLAFGVVVGSGASSLASGSNAPLLVALSPAATPASPSAPSAGPAPTSSPASSASPAAAATPAAVGPPPTVTETIAAQTVTSPASGGGGGGGGGGSSPPPTTSSVLPPVKHVFIVMLSGQGYNQAFGPQSDLPYLAHTLRRQGELFPDYYGVAQSQLANGIALISGQGPTVQTQASCPEFTDITPAKAGSTGQVLGHGCVYPATTPTLPAELTTAGHTWKAYVDGIDNGPAGSAKTCRRPAINGADADQGPQPGDPYVTWRNPFVYFHSLTQGKACANQDVSLHQLSSNLKSAKTTPSLSYVVPTPCEDGSGTVCPPAQPSVPASIAAAIEAATTGTTSTGTTSTSTTTATPPTTTTISSPPTTSTPTTPTVTPTTPTTTATSPVTSPDIQASNAATDKFLQTVVPEIEHSPGFKHNGLIAITFDEAPQTGPNADQTACCQTPAYPNLPRPSSSSTSTSTTTTSTATSLASTTTTTATLPTISSPSSSTTSTSSTTTAPLVPNGETTPTGGGGQVGLLLISPYIKPNTSDTIDFLNHYSLLASIELLFSVQRLGYASIAQLSTLEPGVFSAYKGG